MNHLKLIGGLEPWNLILHILGIVILTDELIFFRGVGQPPTRKFRAGKIIELIGGLMVINDDDWLVDFRCVALDYWR